MFELIPTFWIFFAPWNMGIFNGLIPVIGNVPLAWTTIWVQPYSMMAVYKWNRSYPTLSRWLSILFLLVIPPLFEQRALAGVNYYYALYTWWRVYEHRNDPKMKDTPLSMHEAWLYLQWTVHDRVNGARKIDGGPRFPMGALTKLYGCMAIMSGIYMYHTLAPGWSVFLWVYIFLHFLDGVYSAWGGFVGLDLTNQCMIWPLLLNTGLSDLWRRWDRPIQMALYSTIFRPLRKRGWSRGSCMFATFMLSGVFHGSMMFPMVHSVNDAMVVMCLITTYFLVQAVVVGLERQATQASEKGTPGGEVARTARRLPSFFKTLWGDFWFFVPGYFCLRHSIVRTDLGKFVISPEPPMVDLPPLGGLAEGEFHTSTKVSEPLSTLPSDDQTCFGDSAVVCGGGHEIAYHWDAELQNWYWKATGDNYPAFLPTANKTGFMTRFQTADGQPNEYQLTTFRTMLKFIPRDLSIRLQDGSNVRVHSAVVRTSCPGFTANGGTLSDDPASVIAFVEAVYTGTMPTGELGRRHLCPLVQIAGAYNCQNVLNRALDAVAEEINMLRADDQNGRALDELFYIRADDEDFAFYDEVVGLLRSIPRGKREEKFQTIVKTLFELDQEASINVWARRHGFSN